MKVLGGPLHGQEVDDKTPSPMPVAEARGLVPELALTTILYHRRRFVLPFPVDGWKKLGTNALDPDDLVDWHEWRGFMTEQYRALVDRQAARASHAITLAGGGREYARHRNGEGDPMRERLAERADREVDVLVSLFGSTVAGDAARAA